MMRWVWSCLLVGVLLAPGAGIPDTAAQDTGAYVCVHQVTGHVRFVSGPDECYPSETGRSLQGGGGLPYMVVDADKKPIGETIRLDKNTATVVLTYENAKFALDVTSNGFVSPGGLTFAAEAGGCSGPDAYYQFGTYVVPWSTFKPAVVASPNATLYIEDPTRGQLIGPARGWVLSTIFTPPTCIETYLYGVFDPVTPLVDLSTLFTVPFRLE